MVSQLDRAIARHRADIRRIDQTALSTLELAYQNMIARLDPLIERAQQQVNDEGAATPAQITRLHRYEELQRQAAVELERLARLTGNVTAQTQAQAVQAELAAGPIIAGATARSRTDATAITLDWTHLPTWAVEDLIGTTKSGPVADMLGDFGRDGQRFMTEALVNGLALGQSPRTVARAMHRGLDISRNRSLTIARTEMMRSLRGAAQRNYEANSDILKGWYWVSAHSARTCAACLAMDGTFHSLTETLESHPACRCAMRPALKNPRARTIPTGAEWLATQPVAAQDAILGKSGGAAYRAGEVALSDFVRREHSAVWGNSVRDGGVGWARMQAGQERRAA